MEILPVLLLILVAALPLVGMILITLDEIAEEHEYDKENKL